MSNWDLRWLNAAKFFSEFSKDPSTKVGAVIIHPDGKHMVSFGYNGFPSKIKDDSEILNDRQRKYDRTIHAELNAILNAKCDLTNCSLYTWPLPTCHQCSLSVIQSGIIKVVYPNIAFPARWYQSVKLAGELYKQAQIECYSLDIENKEFKFWA